MEPLQIAERLKERFPDEVLDIKEFRGQVSVTIGKGNIVEISRFLHDEPDLSFDYLVDPCGVDYLGKKDNRFEVVYHLFSMKHRHAQRIKAEVPENDARIDSVMPVVTCLTDLTTLSTSGVTRPVLRGSAMRSVPILPITSGCPT